MTLRPMLALLTLALLAACSPRPFSAPQLVAGDSRTVSFQAGQWSDVTPAAERYCSNYGKSAKPKGRNPLNQSNLQWIYYFNCVDDGR